MIIEINFAYGKGSAKINLENLFPTTAANMKKVVSILDQAADPFAPAESIYKYIAEKVNELKKQRSEYNANINKKEVFAINTEMKKWIANGNALASAYGLEELTDQEAQIKMTFCTVYAVQHERGKGATVKEFSGWTFEKAGYRFEVYKAGKGLYNIILSGTGLKFADCTNRQAAPAEVTQKIIDLFQKQAEKIEAYKKQFQHLRGISGLSEDPSEQATVRKSRPIQEQEEQEPKQETEVKPEADPEPKQETEVKPEPKQEPKTEAEPKTEIIEYSITPIGTVTMFRSGKIVARKRIDENGYFELLAAANAERVSRGKEIFRPAILAPEPEAPEAPEPQRRENISNTAGATPEKTFIGQVISGTNWKILFDQETQRTRVFLESGTEQQKNAITAAGFWWSGAMKTYNKKLTFKAYRAAKQLAETLEAMAG